MLPPRERVSRKGHEFDQDTCDEEWSDAGGCCRSCGRDLADPEFLRGVDFIFEHDLPVWLGGSKQRRNCKLHCIDCKKGKDKIEAGERARGYRAQARHEGTLWTRNPVPGSRAHYLGKRANGEVYERRSGRVLKEGRKERRRFRAERRAARQIHEE